MKDRWKFCQCCYLNGHCENQDRDMKCETYPKQLEDKVERLQEQKQKVIALIKDGRFVEALQELENER